MHEEYERQLDACAREIAAVCGKTFTSYIFQLDVCAREIAELKEKVEYWKAEAVKNAAELGEIKIKAARETCPHIETGRQVWTRYSLAVIEAEVKRVEIDNEGTRIYLFCEALGGELERRPEEIYESALEAIESLEEAL